jgi:quinol monooxygenase YgiN
MVVEYIRYRVPLERHDEFVDAYAQAQAALDDSPHCLAYEVSHGIEEPDNYVVRIEWDSVEGHEQGFRQSPGFGPFFAAVKPFFEQIEEMRHYEPTPIAGAA